VAGPSGAPRVMAGLGWKAAASLEVQYAHRPMDRLFVALGAISALISVAAGAFGAHGLRSRLAPELLAVFETGAR
jgi:hypothetical protein